jgi:hypothetical protein
MLVKWSINMRVGNILDNTGIAKNKNDKECDSA